MALIKGKQLAANTVTFGKLQTIDEAKLLVGAADGQIAAVALSADATITAAGALTIANSAITTAKIADTSVTTGKLADDAVTLAKIADAAFASDFTSGEFSKLPTVSVVKTYVDSVAQGLDVKDSVTAIATGNLDITATLVGVTVDGVTLAADQRVLLAGQTTASQNGIYIVKAAAVPERASDFATGSSAAGAFTFVEQGTSYADTGWVCSTNQGSAVVGTNALAFTQFSSAGIVLAGDGLQKVGNTLSVKLNGSSITASSSGIRVPNQGITSLELATSAFGYGIAGGNGSQVVIDPHPQASVGIHPDGVYSAVLKLQRAATIATSADGDKATNTFVSNTPAGLSSISVCINGVEVYLAGNKTGDCYFSSDNGTTAKSLISIAQADTLHWNGSIAGYQLDANDIVTIKYSALNVP